MTITLGDSFQEVFNERLKVSAEVVEDAFNNFSRSQRLENDISLYLKEFDDDKYSTLLLGTQTVNRAELFGFAYWIPRKFISNEIPLLNLLEIFANSFGCRVKIAEHEGYFIEKARRLILGKLEAPSQLIEVLGPVHIPCDLYIFYNENHGYELQWVDCYYAFAINNNKYLGWLYDVETVAIKVPVEWYNYLCEVRDTLDPFGKTKLTILKPTKKANEGLTSHKAKTTGIVREMEFEIPKCYLHPFNHISSVLSQLDDKGKIVIIPRLEKSSCVFCDARITSDEHIFPIWLRAYFEEKWFDGSVYSRAEGENLASVLSSGVSKGLESSYGFTTQQVCIDCNNQWMSDLEQTAKAILTKNTVELNSTTDALGLRESSAKSLAQWAIVKALLLAHKTRLVPPISKDTYKAIKSGDIPQGFLVELAESDASDLNFMVTLGASAFGSLLRLKSFDRKRAELLTNDFFMVCMQIGNFLFRVSYFDESNGLKREAAIKRTTVLSPSNYYLPFKTIENENEIWDGIEQSLKLHFFGLSISLTDDPGAA